MPFGGNEVFRVAAKLANASISKLRNVGVNRFVRQVQAERP